jgi:hypothetical protein
MTLIPSLRLPRAADMAELRTAAMLKDNDGEKDFDRSQFEELAPSMVLGAAHKIHPRVAHHLHGSAARERMGYNARFPVDLEWASLAVTHQEVVS